MIQVKFDSGSAYIYANRMPAAEQEKVRSAVNLLLPNHTSQEQELVSRVAERQLELQEGGVAKIEADGRSLTAVLAVILSENDIEVIARPEVVKAVDEQISPGEMPENRVRAYQLTEELARKLEPARQMDNAELQVNAGQLMRDNAIGTRLSSDAVSAVNSQIAGPIGDEALLNAYEIVQRKLSSSAQPLSQRELISRTVTLLHEHSIPTKVTNLRELLETLQRNFSSADTAWEAAARNGSESIGPDGLIEAKDLDAIRTGENGRKYPADLEIAVKFLNENAALRNYLDTGAGVSSGKADGRIGYGDVESLLELVNRTEMTPHSILVAMSDVAGGTGPVDGLAASQDLRVMGGATPDMFELLGADRGRDFKDAMQVLSFSAFATGGDYVRNSIMGLGAEKLGWAKELVERGTFEGVSISDNPDRGLVADIFLLATDVNKAKDQVTQVLDNSTLPQAQRTVRLTEIYQEHFQSYQGHLPTK